jgi:hypothetical protein
MAISFPRQALRLMEGKGWSVVTMANSGCGQLPARHTEEIRNSLFPMGGHHSEAAGRAGFRDRLREQGTDPYPHSKGRRALE